MGFKASATAFLKRMLDPKIIKQRKGPDGKPVQYMEGWQVIDNANEAFGHGGWSQIIVSERFIDYDINRQENHCVAAHFVHVRIKIPCEDGTICEQDGTSVGKGTARTLADAMDHALKVAHTDAIKRAFKNHGNQFGNPLYDKEQRNVGVEPDDIRAPISIAPIDEGFDRPALPDRSQPSISQRAMRQPPQQPQPPRHVEHNGPARKEGVRL